MIRLEVIPRIAVRVMTFFAVMKVMTILMEVMVMIKLMLMVVMIRLMEDGLIIMISV